MFACEFCPQTFSRSDNAFQHLRLHTIQRGKNSRTTFFQEAVKKYEEEKKRRRRQPAGKAKRRAATAAAAAASSSSSSAAERDGREHSPASFSWGLRCIPRYQLARAHTHTQNTQHTQHTHTHTKHTNTHNTHTHTRTQRETRDLLLHRIAALHFPGMLHSKRIGAVRPLQDRKLPGSHDFNGGIMHGLVVENIFSLSLLLSVLFSGQQRRGVRIPGSAG